MKWLSIVGLLSSTLALGQKQEFRSKIVTCPTGQDTCDFYNKQWNMANHLTVNPWGVPIRTPGDINIEAAWAEGLHGSASMVVAVIDTGVDIHHPDLVDNIFTNTLEIPDNGIDDDGNGYVDDSHGWNFIKNTNDVRDFVGHGTHIAGVIGARGDNDFGVRGVNWNVKILPIVYLDENSSGNLQNSIDAVHYAVNMGAKIINASWGGTLPDALREAINWARSKGVLFICSSGNDGENLDIYPYFPPSFGLENMIVVGSSDFNDAVTGDSNWGRRTVDILAPGIEILSTLPDARYGYMSGTSMSTPHVSGAAALLWSVHPEWTYKEVKAALLKGSFLKNEYFNRVREGRLDIGSTVSGKINDKRTPDEQDWVSREENRVVAYDKSGIHAVTLSAADGKVVRVRLRDVVIKSGQQRIVIEDASGQSTQKLVSSTADLMTEYVFGNKLTIKFIVDRDGEPLQATIDTLQFVP